MVVEEAFLLESVFVYDLSEALVKHDTDGKLNEAEAFRTLHSKEMCSFFSSVRSNTDRTWPLSLLLCLLLCRYYFFIDLTQNIQHQNSVLHFLYTKTQEQKTKDKRWVGKMLIKVASVHREGGMLIFHSNDPAFSHSSSLVGQMWSCPIIAAKYGAIVIQVNIIPLQKWLRTRRDQNRCS